MLCFSVEAQTNVSGGIYTNTTWTKANSPYVVTDTVAVFPGVTLTIEPGVVIKFEDNMVLEIRQAKLISTGIKTDSITFTSNSVKAEPGAWAGIYLNECSNITFKYCNIKYAKRGVISNSGSPINITNSNLFNNYIAIGNMFPPETGGFIIDSCNIENNIYGVYFVMDSHYNLCNFSNNKIALYNINFSTIERCTIKSNEIGVIGSGEIKNCTIDSNRISGITWSNILNPNFIKNCKITNNGIGINDSISWGNSYIEKNIIEKNKIGIIKKSGTDKVFCNKISDNTNWDLYCDGKDNFSFFSNNDWGTDDSAIISSHIYDGYDNVNLGLVTFIPVDTTKCYSEICNLQVSANVINAKCDTCNDGSATAFVMNGTAPYTFTWYTSPLQTTQTVSGLRPGTYTVCVTDANGCSACNYSVIVNSYNCSYFQIFANSANASCSTCADGYAWVSDTIFGGYQPYTYLWNTDPVQTKGTAVGLLPGDYSVCVTDKNGCIACDSVKVIIGGCDLQLSVNISDATCDTCSNGAATAKVSKGVKPYTYIWNTSPVQTSETATNLSPGIYSVTATDAIGCTVSNNYILVQTLCSNFYFFTNSSDASCSTCADGYAWVSDTIGGTPPYSYLWNTNPVQTTQIATGLLPGDYYVCVTDKNGCVACDTVKVIIGDCNLQLSVNISDATCASCNDGAATAQVSKGVKPYTYIWNTSPVQTTETATNLYPGNYRVTVTDAIGCTASDEFVISYKLCLNFYILTNSKSASCGNCANGYAWVSDTIYGGTPPYTYFWNTNPVQTTQIASGLLPGNYYVCVTDNKGCIACDSVTVENPDCSAFFDLYSTSTPHIYNAVNLASGVEPLEYYWTWGDGSFDTIAYPTHNYDSTGFYKICLRITDFIGCEKTYCNSYYLLKSNKGMISVVVIPYDNTGIKQKFDNKLFKLYPNPSSDNLNIDLGSFIKNIEITICDITGKDIYELKYNEVQIININTRSFPPGLYLVRIQSPNSTTTRKFIKF